MKGTTKEINDAKGETDYAFWGETIEYCSFILFQRPEFDAWWSVIKRTLYVCMVLVSLSSCILPNLFDICRRCWKPDRILYRYYAVKCMTSLLQRGPACHTRRFSSSSSGVLFDRDKFIKVGHEVERIRLWEHIRVFLLNFKLVSKWVVSPL